MAAAGQHAGRGLANTAGAAGDRGFMGRIRRGGHPPGVCELGHLILNPGPKGVKIFV